MVYVNLLEGIKHFMTKKLPWSPRGPEVDQLQCPVVRFLHGEHQDVTFIQVLEPLKNKDSQTRWCPIVS